MKPTTNSVPKHVGIILDGNRRFAKRIAIKPWKGHDWGAKKVEKLLEWCKELDIKELTLYAFSIENFNRPKKEFNMLMKIFVDSFKKTKEDSRLNENEIKINFIGRIHLFPEDVQQEMKELMEITKDYTKYTVNFAMAYGGRDEIVDATRKIAEQIKQGSLNIEDINKELFQKNLYLNSCPEMIIRTGGEKRSSNFLPYQSVYSEWFYLEKMWPEFEKEDLIECLQEFSNRKRRFGK
jgi:tritrans,polycis-undecaprenyl-diphosphate synthase [geranylgeranyl-diphosphate specific]